MTGCLHGLVWLLCLGLILLKVYAKNVMLKHYDLNFLSHNVNVASNECLRTGVLLAVWFLTGSPQILYHWSIWTPYYFVFILLLYNPVYYFLYRVRIKILLLLIFSISAMPAGRPPRLLRRVTSMLIYRSSLWLWRPLSNRTAKPTNNSLHLSPHSLF